MLDRGMTRSAPDAARCRLHYREHGFVIIRQVLDAARIAAFGSTVDAIFRQWLNEYRSDYAERGLVNMHSLTHAGYHAGSEARIRFFEHIADSSVTSLVDAMFGDGIYFHNTQLFFNPRDADQPPYWHRDLQFSPIADAEQAAEQGRLLSLHVRIPLVAEKGIAIIPGTHRRWDTSLEAAVRFEREGHRRSDDLPGMRLISLEPGDLLIFDAQMIHRGVYRQNARRMAFDLCIGQPHPFTLPYLDHAVLPTAAELPRIANNAWYRHAFELVQSAG